MDNTLTLENLGLSSDKENTSVENKGYSLSSFGLIDSQKEEAVAQTELSGGFNPEDIPEPYSENIQSSAPVGSKTNLLGRPIQSVVNQGLDFMQGINQIAAGTVDFVTTEPLEAILKLTGRADKALTGTDTLGISNINIPKLGDTVQGQFSEGETGEFYQKAGQYAGIGAGLTSGVKKGVDYVTNQAYRHFIGTDSVTLGVMKQISQNPLYKEIAAGATAAGGGEIGSKYGGTLGEFVGTLLGGTLPYVQRLNPKKLIKDSPETDKTRYSDSTERSAASVIKGYSTNPNKALSRLEERSARSNLTAAQKTDDPMIMELERSLALENHHLAGTYQDRFRQAQLSFKEELDAILLPDGNVDRAALSKFLLSKQKDLINQIDDRMTSAYTNIKNIASIADKDPVLLSKTIRQEMDNAYNSLKSQEQKLWASVRDDIQVDTREVKQAALDMIASATKSTRLPVKELEFILGRKIINTADGWVLGKPLENKPFLSESESARELINFRSNVNADIRQQQAGTALKTLSVKNLNEIQAALINSLDNPLYVGEDVRGAYDTAKAFTKKFHEVYEQGIIGKTLRKSKTGDSVAPEGTLQSILGSTEVTQAVGIRELKEFEALIQSVGNSTAPKSKLLKTAAQFLANNFRETVTDATSAQKFLIENRQALKNLPELNQAVQQAVKGVFKETARLSSLESRKKLIESKSLYKLSGQNGNEVVSTILKSIDPTAAANNLFKKIRKDPDAMKAMKNSIGEYILDRVLITGKAFADVEQQVSKKGIVKVLKKEMRPLLEKFYTKENWRNLNIILQDVATLTASENTRGKSLPINRNLLLDLLGKLTVTQTIKSGSIVVQSGLAKMSRMFTDQLTDKDVKKLLAEAVIDDRILKILLKKNLSKEDIITLNTKTAPIKTAFGIKTINDSSEGEE